MLWKVKGSVCDPVHKVERDPLDMVTAEHDKVIFEDQECVVCYQNKTLFFVIPMIHPENIRRSDPLAVTSFISTHSIPIAAAFIVAFSRIKHIMLEIFANLQGR